MPMTKKGKAVPILLLGVLLVVALPIGVQVYQTSFHPLARIEKNIEVGNDLALIRARIAAYCSERADQSEFSCTLDGQGPVSGWEHLCPSGSDKYLHVYEWQFLDDIQLYVFGDSEDRVCATMYWGD